MPRPQAPKAISKPRIDKTNALAVLNCKATTMGFAYVSPDDTPQYYFRISHHALWLFLYVILGVFAVGLATARVKFYRRHYIFVTVLVMLNFNCLQLSFWGCFTNIAIAALREPLMLVEGLIIQGIGIALNIWVIRRALRRVAEGHYKKGGLGFFDDNPDGITFTD